MKQTIKILNQEEVYGLFSLLFGLICYLIIFVIGFIFGYDNGTIFSSNLVMNSIIITLMGVSGLLLLFAKKFRNIDGINSLLLTLNLCFLSFTLALILKNFNLEYLKLMGLLYLSSIILTLGLLIIVIGYKLSKPKHLNQLYFEQSTNEFKNNIKLILQKETKKQKSSLSLLTLILILNIITTNFLGIYFIEMIEIKIYLFTFIGLSCLNIATIYYFITSIVFYLSKLKYYQNHDIDNTSNNISLPIILLKIFKH